MRLLKSYTPKKLSLVSSLILTILTGISLAVASIWGGKAWIYIFLPIFFLISNVTIL